MSNPAEAKHILEIERIFKAPRETVFALWTEPRHIVKWDGPRGHFMEHCEQDFRVGGRWRFAISAADGTPPAWTWGRYLEIEAPAKLVFSYSMDWHRYETLVTLLFEDLGETTRMNFRQEEFLTALDRDDHGWGWNAAFDKLAETILRMHGAGLIHSDLHDPARRSSLQADIEDARRRAETEARERPEETVPPSMEARKTMQPPPVG